MQCHFEKCLVLSIFIVHIKQKIVKIIFHISIVSVMNEKEMSLVRYMRQDINIETERCSRHTEIMYNGLRDSWMPEDMFLVVNKISA